AVVLDADEACVSVQLCFRGRHAAADLDLIRQDEATIETELDEQVDWERDENPTRAALYLDSAQATNRADWPRQHNWLTERLSRFIAVMTPRVCTAADDAVDPAKVRSAFWTELDRHREGGPQL